ncbi:hypothetical protein [Reyranella sp.]|jgi:hypothetical protein|uniref:hypothetical protein n=1 Tax=Reyranella sp. TaxID=1929291 RepID=UPI003F6F69C7
MRSFRLLICVAMTALASLFAVGSAQADETFTFRVKSDYQYKVQIAFFSQSRSYVWPGPGRAFSLDDARTQSFPLSCESGEKICYGAWVTGDGNLSWGVGPKNDQGCKNCCFVCGDADMTPVLTLSD